MKANITGKLVVLSAVASLAVTAGAQARNGADDPAGHNANDVVQVRGGGADDPATHDRNDDRRARTEARHRHRHHHGAHHARHGADDPAGHR